MGMRHFFFTLLLTITSATISAQTLISGVINDYVDVTAIDATSSSIEVSDATDFSAGDRVLLIQMKGAIIDETDSDSYGTISDYNNAGNYEFQTICSIEGNEIFFSYELVKDYELSGAVQLVRVPVYEDATISGGNVTALPWDGEIGGIVVFEVAGTLDFGTQNINVEEQGFRGGDAELSGGGCSGIFLDATYYSDVTSADQRARKGEGIAEFIVTKECGRGPQANGGGGGNNHNAGGCGGGNYGAGGAGGRRIKPSTFACGSLVGVESKALASAYTSDQLFLGGGGGAGHGNNSGFASENGLNGGGIVIIKAGTINGNSQVINANGGQHTDDSEEGGGGGGAGGTVLLSVGSYDSPLTVEVEGGEGTSTENIGPSNCNGPGGGGGGGVVWSSGASFPTSVSASVFGGSCGIISSTSQPGCVIGSTNDGTDGADGATLTGLVLIEGTTPNSTGSTTEIACQTYTVPSGDETYTTTGIYTDTIPNSAGCDSVLTIDLTINTVDISVTESDSSLMAAATGASYQWIDCHDLSPISGETNADFVPDMAGDYAVIVTENGCTDTSDCYPFEPLGINTQESDWVSIYPNPAKDQLSIELKSGSAATKVELLDTSGRLLKADQFDGTDHIEIALDFPAAVYFLHITTSYGSIVKKVLIE